MELPELGRNGVLIQVKACGLSLSRVESTVLCHILSKGNNFCIGAGHDVAGVVVAAGEDVTTLSKGDHVVGKLGIVTFCSKHLLVPVITSVIHSLRQGPENHQDCPHLHPVLRLRVCVPVHLLPYMHLWCGQGKLFLLTFRNLASHI